MTNGKINEINKLLTDKIQTQSDAITAQVKEFEKKLVSILKLKIFVRPKANLWSRSRTVQAV